MTHDKLAECCGVVRFHVIHDDIVKLSARKQMLNAVKEDVGHFLVYRIEQNCFFVKYEIRII